jgi:hypothetical protein
MKRVILLACMFMVSIGKAAIPDGNEFTKIRLEYAASPQAELHWATNDERIALLELYKSDKKKFVEAGAKWLSRCPVDAKVQLMMGNALSELGRPRETVRYRYFFYGLMQSIIADHDGLSKASAFKVISIDEEYTLCNYLNAKVLGHELNGFYDVLKVEINGEKKELYFDASIPLKALQSELKK